MTRMRAKAKICTVFVTVSLACLFMLLPTAAGVGSITLTPTAQAPGASVSVTGTGFKAGKNVTIGFGNEVVIVQELFVPVITGPNTRGYNWTNRPIKPGSMHIHLYQYSTGGAFDYTDDGAGNIYQDTGTFFGILDYALGGFYRNSTNNPADYEFTATYTFYLYNNVTSFGRVTTTGSGAFSANFTVPAVANGNYNVTAIDSGGTLATATLNVNSTIPEVLPFGAILLLSSVAVVAGSWHFRKRPKITE
jgi:hypothetical protein